MSQGGKYYLIGFMGAGKTVVGLNLAELMGMEFADLDRMIEARTKMPIAEIFAEQGEAAFRRLESEALASLADRKKDLVVATGGGTATRRVNVEIMRTSGTTVWLAPPVEVILDRLTGSSRHERPLFESPAQARGLYERRCEAYAHADFKVELAKEEGPEDIAKRIVRILSQSGSRGRRPADT